MKTTDTTIKTAVVYFSQTGNTAKVGAAIAAAAAEQTKGAGAADTAAGVLLTSLTDAPSLEDRDLVFVGMPILKFGAPDEARTFLAEQCSGRRVALFVTHAAPEGLPELEPWLDDCRQAAAGTELVGFFNCQGQLAEPVKRWMLGSDMPELVRFAEMSGCADGQPDERALAGAAEFARAVARRVWLETAEGEAAPEDATRQAHPTAL